MYTHVHWSLRFKSLWMGECACMPVWAHTLRSTHAHLCMRVHVDIWDWIILDNSSIIVNEAGSTSLLLWESCPTTLLRLKLQTGRHSPIIYMIWGSKLCFHTCATSALNTEADPKPPPLIFQTAFLTELKLSGWTVCPTSLWYPPIFIPTFSKPSFLQRY